MLVDGSNNVAREWTWDRRRQNAGTPPEGPLEVVMTPQLVCRFTGRRDIVVTYQCKGVHHVRGAAAVQRVGCTAHLLPSSPTSLSPAASSCGGRGRIWTGRAAVPPASRRGRWRWRWRRHRCRSGSRVWRPLSRARLRCASQAAGTRRWRRSRALARAQRRGVEGQVAHSPGPVRDGARRRGIMRGLESHFRPFEERRRGGQYTPSSAEPGWKEAALAKVCAVPAVSPCATAHPGVVQ